MSDFTLCVNPTGARLAAVRACEAAVFLDAYGNTLDQLDAEYGPYDESSVFIGVLDATGTAVGAARLIRPGVAGLKTLHDVARDPWQVDGPRSAAAAGIHVRDTWDVATLAVRRGQGRSGLISGALYHGMIQTLRLNQARWIVMLMDIRARRLLDIAGLRTHALPGTAAGEYLGSKATVPLWARLSTMMDGQRTRNPDAFRTISLGVGLDGVQVPGPAEFVLDTAASQRPLVALAG